MVFRISNVMISKRMVNNLGLPRERVGVNFVYVLPFSWTKRETQNQKCQDISGTCRDSSGRIPGRSCEVLVLMFSCCCFLALITLIAWYYERFPKGTWHDDNHKARKFMQLGQRLLSFWLVISQSLHVVVVARFCKSCHVTVVLLICIELHQPVGGIFLGRGGGGYLPAAPCVTLCAYARAWHCVHTCVCVKC